MNWEDYNKLKELVKKDLTITQDNVLEKSLGKPFVYHKYLDIFTNETKIYKELLKRKNDLYSKLYKKNKFENNIQLDSKSEVEVFIDGDEEYSKLSHECDIQKTILQYLESLLTNIQNIGYDIKNFIEYTKWLSGR